MGQPSEANFQPGAEFSPQVVLLDLYRYFLAWSGDPELACQFSLAVFRLPSHSKPARRIDLLAAARYQRAFRSRVNREKPSGCADALESLGLPARLALARVATLLQSLSEDQADAVILSCFVGLSFPELALVLGKSQGVIEPTLQEGITRLNHPGQSSRAHWALNLEDNAAIQEELQTLSNSISLPAGLAERVQQEFLPPSPSSVKPALRYGLSWSGHYKFRKALNRVVSASPLLLVFLVLLVGYMQIKPSEPSQPVSPAKKTDEVVSVHTLSYITIGQLVQPGQSTCSQWQARLSTEFGAGASVQSGVPFKYPGFGSDQNALGVGCRLLLRLDLPSVVDIPALLDRASGLFVQQGFSTVNPFDCSDCLPNDAVLPGVWSGQVIKLQKGDLQAILLVASRQNGAATCSENPCPTAFVSQVAVQILLAQDAVSPALQAFLDAWQHANRQALQDLSPGLGKAFSSIQSLDAEVGIHREPADSLRFTWKLVGNQGQTVRFSIQGLLSSWIALPTRSISPFNIQMSGTPSGWKVSGLTRQVIFPPSSDSIIYADKDGNVFRYHLSDGAHQELPGVFHPAGEELVRTAEDSIIQRANSPAATKVNKIFSPDKKLVVYYPNPYSDLPDHSIRILTNDSIHTGLWEASFGLRPTIAWTSDSQNILIGSEPYQLGPVYRLDAQTGENQKIADNVFWIGIESNPK